MIGAACNSRFPQAKEGEGVLITGGSLYSILVSLYSCSHQKWSKLGALLQRNVNEEDNGERFQNFDSAPSYYKTLHVYDSVERCKHVKSQATTVYFRLGRLRRVSTYVQQMWGIIGHMTVEAGNAVGTDGGSEVESVRRSGGAKRAAG
jgi:hypothetical protein